MTVPDRAGVRVVPARGDELVSVVRLFESVWGTGRSPDAPFFTALAHAGNPVHLALDGDTPVGAAFAMLGWNGGLHLHSHMAAVAPSHRGSGVGVQLKLAQRDEALANGVEEIRWTYDPLVLRNARFNLQRLGAQVLAFHPSFYGRLGDSVNGDDETDRFEVTWRLRSDRVLRALARAPRDPVGGRLFELPADYHQLRRERPRDAAELRSRFRDVVPPALAAGAAIEVADDGYLLVEEG